MVPVLIKAAVSHFSVTSVVSKQAIEDMANVSIDAGYIKDVKKKQFDLSKFVDLTLLNELKSGK